MKKRFLAIGIVLVGCAAAIACVTYQYPTGSNRPVATEVAPPAGGSDQPFYDDLTPYGRWVYVAGPGWVWSPHSVQAGWRPYLFGHWVFTDYGWTWASDEQWGWAVYHYGRWHQDPSYGWVWVPGTEWGPAWVAWHEGGGYVGWAPLPWQVRVRAGVGLDWGGVNLSLESSSWCFVNSRNLVDPGLRNHIVPPSRNVTLIQVTRNVTNYTYIDNRVVNQGVRVESIGRAVGHTIPRYRVAETESRETTRGGKVKGQEFIVFRPDPRRGHTSQGRTDPPGHDEKERPRDFRTAPPQPEPAPAGAQPAPAPQASTPPEPPSTVRGHETQNHGHESHESRGRKYLDALTGKQPPRRSPQGTAPSQPAPPTQPSGAPSEPPTATPQPSGATAPPAEARPGSPPSGDQHSATTPPSRPAPAKGQPPRPNGKGPKKAPPKGEKPKPDAPKSDGSDSDKPKEENPNSDH
jgi:hypothetical protein